MKVSLGVTFRIDASSLRRSRRCGSESLDGREPEDSCDEALARDVMES